MATGSGKFLRCHCGPHHLLVDLDAVVEIVAWQSGWCADSGSSFAHHGKPVRWRDQELPLHDLRRSLGLPANSLQEPGHALVLRDSDNGQPRAMVAVDSVEHIVATSATDWYRCNGIDPRLDHYFDRLLPDADQLWLCLAPVNRWVDGSAP